MHKPAWKTLNVSPIKMISFGSLFYNDVNGKSELTF